MAYQRGAIGLLFSLADEDRGTDIAMNLLMLRQKDRVGSLYLLDECIGSRYAFVYAVDGWIDGRIDERYVIGRSVIFLHLLFLTSAHVGKGI